MALTAGLGWLAPALATTAANSPTQTEPAWPDAATSHPAAQARDPFGLSALHKLHLTFSAADWEALQKTEGPAFPGGPGRPAPPPTRSDTASRDVHRTGGTEFPWAHAALTVDGAVFTNVAVRYKGSFTFMASSHQLKRSLKIALDHYDKDAPRFHGLKTFNLHAGIMDPTRVHEALSYAVFRDAGVPAPRTAFAEVTLTVPGKYERELLGLFTLTEQVDKPFLKDRFGTDKGLLMKPAVRGPDYFGEDWARYADRYRPHREASAGEARQVIRLARVVNQAGEVSFIREIGSCLDVDGFLRFLAVNALLVNLDSPLAMPQNYYLYLHPKSGKIVFFPWDLDLSLAAWPMGGPAEQQMNLSLLHPHAGEHKLIDRLLADPDTKARYLRLIQELARTAFSKERLLGGIQAIEQVTKDPLQREAKAAAARHEAGFSFGPPGGVPPAPEPRTFVEKRTESVRAQLAGETAGYVPAAGFGPPGPPRGDGPPRLPPAFQEKLQKLQAALGQAHQNGFDLAPVGRTMEKFGRFVQAGQFKEAEAALDEALRLLAEKAAK